jgi:hypothetical protein
MEKLKTPVILNFFYLEILRREYKTKDLSQVWYIGIVYRKHPVSTQYNMK